MVNHLDATLDALADPTRRRVVELLREAARPSTELALAASTTPPAMSRHLRILRQAGLVEGEGVAHDARVRLYRLRDEPFAVLEAWLGDVRAHWQHQLDGFKTYAEGGVTDG